MNTLIFTEIKEKPFTLEWRKALIDTVQIIAANQAFRFEVKKSTIVKTTLLSIVIGSPFIGNEIKYSLSADQFNFLSLYYNGGYKATINK